MSEDRKISIKREMVLEEMEKEVFDGYYNIESVERIATLLSEEDFIFVFRTRLAAAHNPIYSKRNLKVFYEEVHSPNKDISDTSLYSDLRSEFYHLVENAENCSSKEFLDFHGEYHYRYKFGYIDLQSFQTRIRNLPL